MVRLAGVSGFLQTLRCTWVGSGATGVVGLLTLAVICMRHPQIAIRSPRLRFCLLLGLVGRCRFFASRWLAVVVVSGVFY